MEQNQSNQIIREISKGEIQVSRVFEGDERYRKPGTLTAELKQIVTTKTSYPTLLVSNSLNDSLFKTDDFQNVERKEFTSTETRVVHLLVPEGTTVADVQKKLAENPHACIQKVMSFKPILSEEDVLAIKNGIITYDKKAERQATRYPASHQFAGKLYLDKQGNITYRRLSFSLTPKEDIDLRTTEDEVYIPNSLKAGIKEMKEINNHMQEQYQTLQV